MTSSCVCLPAHSGVQCMLLCQRDTKKTGAPVHLIGNSCENGLILRPMRHGPPGDWVGRHCLAKCPGHITLEPAGPATLSSPLRMDYLACFSSSLSFPVGDVMKENRARVSPVPPMLLLKHRRGSVRVARVRCDQLGVQ